LTLVGMRMNRRPAVKRVAKKSTTTARPSYSDAMGGIDMNRWAVVAGRARVPAPCGSGVVPPAFGFAAYSSCGRIGATMLVMDNTPLVSHGVGLNQHLGNMA
jgi:hypothetical protein